MSARDLIAVVLTIASLLSIAQPASADEPLIIEMQGNGPFADDDGSVFESDIVALWDAGIATGCGVGLFCPDVPITRVEMAAMISRARPDLLDGVEAISYADVDPTKDGTAVGLLGGRGITRGCAEGLFCPQDPVTRGQMAAFLRRTFADRLEPGGAASFTDMAGSVFEGDVSWLAATGVTRGCTSSEFCPESPVTRGQMAAFLRRALDLPLVEPHPTILVDLSTPAGAGAEGWRALVAHFFADGDVDRAVDIIDCESGGDPLAKNPRSTASGLFQHLASQWPARAEAAGFSGADVFDPVANTAVAAWLVYEGGGWTHWNASAHCW
ncbi:MAG: S-layer homology domain-containing protein [Acidimicrobiia bacterium]|nr:S-layer homology domain-containing protein [Acidimicrobiia bacterium]